MAHWSAKSIIMLMITTLTVRSTSAALHKLEGQPYAPVRVVSQFSSRDQSG